MNNDFNTLTQFLERFGPEVLGRAALAPDGGEEAKLQRFAAGACNAEERAEVCELLRQNPTWLRWVAERVKQARSTAGGTH